MTFQFKIQLKNITKPAVWRKVQVASETTFSEFHSIIQVAMGWDDYHLYSFSPKGYGSTPVIDDESDEYDELSEMEDNESLPSSKVKLSDIFNRKGQTFTYIYDFGDDWIHKITLEKIDKLNISPIPKLIDGEGACPPEDCGGPWGYENLKEVLADKNHPEYQDTIEWLYGYNYEELLEEDDDIWDPNDFDLEIEKEMFDEVFGDED